MSNFQKSPCSICKLQRPNQFYKECPRMKCFNCNDYGHGKRSYSKLVCFKCEKPGHYSFECDQNMLTMAHPRKNP